MAASEARPPPQIAECNDAHSLDAARNECTPSLPGNAHISGQSIWPQWMSVVRSEADTRPILSVHRPRSWPHKRRPNRLDGPSIRGLKRRPNCVKRAPPRRRPLQSQRRQRISRRKDAMTEPDRFLMAGVMGFPVMHSRSPTLHNYWLEKHGIAGRYMPLAIKPDGNRKGAARATRARLFRLQSDHAAQGNRRSIHGLRRRRWCRKSAR